MAIQHFISESELELLKGYGDLESYKRSDIIFSQGDKDTNLHIIISGRISLSSQSYLGISSARHRISDKISEFVPYECVGILSFLNDTPHQATATVLEDSESLSLSQAQAEEFLKDHSELGIEFMKYCLTSLQKITKSVMTHHQNYIAMLESHSIK